MKIAVLDLGTNTFHLLIADKARDSSFQILFKSQVVVKLGEGAIHQNQIARRPYQRGIRALEHYAEIIRRHRVRNVYAFATSAIRGAVNGKDFMAEVKQRTGIRIRVIPGKEEARLICLGVRQCVDLGDQPVLIMDIGGGSTEFIIANQRRIFWKNSFRIGAARMLELFQPSDPVRRGEIKKTEEFLDQQLAPLWAALKKFPVSLLIGSSGSFDSFAGMIGYRFYGKNIIRNVTYYPFHLNDYLKLHEILIRSSAKQRNRMKGLVKMRVNMIVLASICTRFVLKKSGIRELALSKYALKEGALYDLIQRPPH